MAEYTPTVAQVAALIRARTKVGMTEVGTFTDDTRPTRTEVEGLIDMAEGLVYPALGSAVPERLHLAVLNLIAVRAALLVELSYFPEQAQEPQSVAEQLQRVYADALGSIRESTDNDGPQGYVIGSLEVGTEADA